MTALLACALGAWLGAAAWLDRGPSASAAPPRRGWDAIVVLGCRVGADGVPSASLDRRVRHAVELWRRGVAPRLVLTGGAGEGEPIAEARAAARLARELGVPDAALLIEERSTSTEENARFARDALGGGRVLVVSDAYHVARGERVFGRYFAEAEGAGVRGAPIGGALREVLALAIYALLGRLEDPALPVEERVATRALAATRTGDTRRISQRISQRIGQRIKEDGWPRRGRSAPRA